MIAPDLLGEPGGFVTLFASVFVAISGFFGGKIGDWVDTLYGKKKEEAAVIAQQVNVEEMKGGVIANHYHEAPRPEIEVHDTIGFIPPVRAVTYVHRGRIEEEVFDHLKQGKSGAIVGVHAPGGLGKTELAKQVAEKLKDDFEILWVDVGEKKPQLVVGELLIKCGMQTQPAEPYERMVNELRHAYQSHKFLILLDDVRKDTLERIGDILPPSPSAALVTSRIQQIGGVTRSFALDAMTREQAQDLFESILGYDVVEHEMDAVRMLAERCKFNPLAMEIAARRIRQFEGVKKPIAKYFEIALAKFSELKMEGDARWDMEQIFDVSYSDLSTDDRERFIALSAFHPSGFSIQAASYLWKTEEPVSRQILSRFINLSLVKIVTGDGERYRLHDLLDEYAASKLKASGKEAQVKIVVAEWLAGLFDEHATMKIESFPVILPERDNLLVFCEWARGEKEAEILAELTTNSRNWFYNYFRDSWMQWYAWLEASLQLGLSDISLKANVLQAIGDVQQFRKENDAALESYNEALKLFQAVGDRLGEANVLQAIGDVQQFRKENDAALESYNEALKLFQAVGDRLGEANVLQAIGDVQQFRDERDAALESYNEALKLFQAVGARLGEANTLQSLGKMMLINANDQPSFEKAMETIQASMNLYEEIKDLVGQVNILMFLSRIAASMNQKEKALEIAQEALPMLVQVAGKTHPVTLSFEQYIEKLKQSE